VEKEQAGKETIQKARKKQAVITTNDPFPQGKKKKMIITHELD